MTSSGYFTVTKEKLIELSKEDQKQFIWEMFNNGGRIGWSEYKFWTHWIGN